MDLSHAVRKFEEYLDHYDRDDDKIRLKITHTYGVVEYSRKIALRLGLPEEDVELAQIIGLLHDIGRFEQIKRFDSFEPATMDHAEFGVRILFEEGMIRRFLDKGDWDQIIETAVARHSDFRLEGIQDARALLHAKIIRDADKLDNCRVKLEDDGSGGNFYGGNGRRGRAYGDQSRSHGTISKKGVHSVFSSGDEDGLLGFLSCILF